MQGVIATSFTRSNDMFFNSVDKYLVASLLLTVFMAARANETEKNTAAGKTLEAQGCIPIPPSAQDLEFWPHLKLGTNADLLKLTKGDIALAQGIAKLRSFRNFEGMGSVGAFGRPLAANSDELIIWLKGKPMDNKTAPDAHAQYGEFKLIHETDDTKKVYLNVWTVLVGTERPIDGLVSSITLTKQGKDWVISGVNKRVEMAERTMGEWGLPTN
jgi:hypothetical protein